MPDEITQLLTGPIADAMGWQVIGGFRLVVGNRVVYTGEGYRPAIVCELLMPVSETNEDLEIDEFEFYTQWEVLLCFYEDTGEFYRELKHKGRGVADTPHDAFIRAFAELLESGWRPQKNPGQN